MKTIKSIFVTILIVLIVKGCFYVTSSMSRMNAESSTASDDRNYPEKSDANASVIPADASASSSEQKGFQRHALGNGVSLAVPESWYVLPGHEVAVVRAAADQAYPDDNSSKETPFAANSSQNPQSHEAQARVSFLAKEFEQADLQSASASDLNGVCDELYNGWMQNPASPRLIDRPQCSVTNLNGKTALLTHYTRAGNVPSTTWTVRMMQVPLESKMALITLTQMDGSAKADQVITEIIASVRFD